MNTLPSFDCFLRSACHALTQYPIGFNTSQATVTPSPSTMTDNVHQSPTLNDGNSITWFPPTYSDQDDRASITESPRTARCQWERRRRTPTLKPKRVKKKYLIEHQRCEIVRRVRQGEKQAHLAKEYGVSRAAVCYLLKHESEILQRWAVRRQRSTTSPIFTSV